MLWEEGKDFKKELSDLKFGDEVEFIVVKRNHKDETALMQMGAIGMVNAAIEGKEINFKTEFEFGDF
jgi:hypothetical protein